MLRAQAGSRRRESRNPERHRAGEREDVEKYVPRTLYVNISNFGIRIELTCVDYIFGQSGIKVLKGRKEGRKEGSATQGLFPPPHDHVVTLVKGLGITFF